LAGSKKGFLAGCRTATTTLAVDTSNHVQNYFVNFRRASHNSIPSAIFVCKQNVHPLISPLSYYEKLVAGVGGSLDDWSFTAARRAVSKTNFFPGMVKQIEPSYNILEGTKMHIPPSDDFLMLFFFIQAADGAVLSMMIRFFKYSCKPMMRL
jgi:hypothetical protein